MPYTLPAMPFDPTVSAAAAGVPIVPHNRDTPAGRALRRVAPCIAPLAAEEAEGREERPWWRRGALMQGEATR